MSRVYLPREAVYHIQLLYLFITINYLKLESEIVVETQIIMDISKFFNSSSKKRSLSDQSWNGEEPKKAREGSLNDSTVSLDDVFTEGMKSPKCTYSSQLYEKY